MVSTREKKHCCEKMKIRSEEKGRRGIGECSKSSCGVKLCFSDSWISVLCAAILILFCHSCTVSVSGEKLHDDVQVVATRKLAKQTLFDCKGTDDAVVYMNENDKNIVKLLLLDDNMIYQFHDPLSLSDCNINNKVEQFERSSKRQHKVSVTESLFFACFDTKEQECFKKLTVHVSGENSNNTKVNDNSIALSSTVTTTGDSMIYYHFLRSPELIGSRQLLQTIVNPPTDYILHCTIEPLGTNSVWSAILLFTNDINSNSGNYGDRTPVVFFPPDSTSLSITTGTNADPNDHNDNNPTDELPLNIPTTVRIEVLGTIRKVFINNAEVISDSIGTRSQLAEVDAYLGGNPYYAAANAMVSDMIFTSNSFSRYDLIPEPELVTFKRLANIVNPPTDYILHLTIEPLGTDSGWSAIVLFTNDVTSNCCNYGDRTTGVWFYDMSTRLLIVTGTDAEGNSNCSPAEELPLNVPTTVRIEVLGTTRKVFYNDVEVCSDSMGTRSQLAEVDAYLGNPHYPAANAMVSDVVFTSTSFSRYDLLPEPELYTTPLLANIGQPPTDYVLQFTIEPLEMASTQYRLILLFTNDVTTTGSGNYGLRTPGVWFRNSSTRLFIATGTDADPSEYCNPDDQLPLNVPTTVRIEVLGTTRKVYYDDVEKCSDSIGTRSQLAEVGVYRQTEFFAAANARLSNIVFDRMTNYETARYGDLISEREAVTTRQHLATLVKPPTDYVLQFTIEPLGTVNVESSILTFTTGNVAWSGQNQYGDRVPMVTFRPDSTRLVVSVGTDADPYYYVEVVDSLPVGIESTVRIEVLGTLLRIFVDNVEKITQVIGTRSQLAEVKAYLGIIDAANAMVSHVTFTKCTNLSSSIPSLLPSVLPSLVPSASFMPSVDQCKNCNDYDLFDCEFLLHQTKQDATAICGFISREKSVKQYCQNQLFKKYKTCTMTKAPSSIPSKVPSISSIPSKVPSIGPCHGISLVLSDDDKGTILSDNSSNEAIVKCFDTSEVTNMDQFLMESNINADLSSWDVSSVTSMQEMFKTASVFNGDISRWDVSVVTSMYNMFIGANAFNSGISGWDVSSVTTMNALFFNAHSFNSDISSWDVSSVTTMNSMFYNANAFDRDISGWDVSSVTRMSSMFYEASIFNKDISSWDVSSVTLMSNMFVQAHEFDNDISRWDVSLVTSMHGMFYHAYSFNKDISSWDVSSVTTMNRMFVLAHMFDRDMSGWDVSSVNDMTSMFYEASIFNKDISSWDVSSVTTLSHTFKKAYMFDNDISRWDVSLVTSMYSMFGEASIFNKDISSWDVSSVTYMNNMFENAIIFNKDISSWDVSAVNTMHSMFKDAVEYRQEMCEWNLEGKSITEMFTNSKCTIAFCVDCPSS